MSFICLEYIIAWVSKPEAKCLLITNVNRLFYCFFIVDKI